jgi:folate-binding protein YgfZ
MLKFYKIRFDFLKFTGNDRLDLIHRLSTNDVNSLNKYSFIKTILTSDKGRIIDLLTLYHFGDFIFAACSEGNSKRVIEHIDKYTVMDDFKAEDMSGTHCSILFYGEGSEEYTKEVFNIILSELNPKEFIVYSEDGRDAVISKNDDKFGGFIFIYALEDKDFYNKKLFDEDLIHNYEITEVSSTEYEFNRISFGIPKSGNEMNDKTNPLECGLEKYVSFTKGCYIGQEVISRLDTYVKISKHLVGIKTSAELSYLNINNVKITFEGNECGYATSLTVNGKSENTGLGFIKTAFLDYNKDYKIKFDKSIYDCKIIKLPFVN